VIWICIGEMDQKQMVSTSVVVVVVVVVEGQGGILP